MRKILICLMMMVLITSGCTKKENTIEGYWMTESGETISFNSDGKAIIDGMALNYSLYGEENLSISFLGMAVEYRYILKGDVLDLIDLKENTKSVFYRDKVKQQKIQEKLDQEKLERERQEIIEKAKKDHEKYIDELKNNVAKNEEKVVTYNKYIEQYNDYIVEADKNIEYELNEIGEMEKEIEQLQYSSDDMAESEIDYKKTEIDYCLANIEYYENEKEYYNSEILKYKENIIKCEQEKEKNIEELKVYGDY